MMQLIVASTTLTVAMAASSSPYNGSRYKLLYKSKSAKSSRSKSAKTHIGKSKRADNSSDDALVHQPAASSKSSKEDIESLLFLLAGPSSYPSVMPVLSSVVPSSPLPHTTADTNSPSPHVTTHPHHQPIFSPHVHDDAESEIMQPSPSPIVIHTLFGTDDDEEQVESSLVPSISSSYDITSSHAPYPTTHAMVPSGASTSPFMEGLFGPSEQDDSTSPIPTLPTQQDDIDASNEPTLEPYSIVITSPTNYDAPFSIFVTLFSKASFAPSSTPTTATSIPSMYPSSSSYPISSSSTPTTSQELNLLNPLEPQGAQQQLQVAPSIMVILACAMAIMGTLFGVFKMMKKDEQRVLDEYGAQLAGAADFDADQIGEVNDVEGGAGVDSHLQLVTD